MLVLALQFSKGDAPSSPAIRKLSRTTTEQLDHQGACTGAVERAVGQTLVPCVAEGERTRTNVRAGSLKTEEKTMSADVATRGGRILRHSLQRRPTRQCTNWELVRTGQDECLPSIERCSLERR